MRLHTRKEFIDLELSQSHEYLLLLQHGLYFPNEQSLNLARELKLLGIQGAVLIGEDFMQIRRLAENTQHIFRWFDNERRMAYPALAKAIHDTYYEKAIIEMIDEIIHVSDRTLRAVNQSADIIFFEVDLRTSGFGFKIVDHPQSFFVTL